MSHIAPIPSPDPATPALDAHGHDPAAYDWVPVLKKRRKDGWSPGKQRAFIEALADGGSVANAARAVGMSESSAYRLRRSPGAEAFDRAWNAAIEAASKKLIDAAFERALIGSEEPVFDRDGNRVGRRLRDPAARPKHAHADGHLAIGDRAGEDPVDGPQRKVGLELGGHGPGGDGRQQPTLGHHRQHPLGADRGPVGTRPDGGHVGRFPRPCSHGR